VALTRWGEEFRDPFDLYGEVVPWDETAPATRERPGKGTRSRPEQQAPQARLLELDALRGWALAYMLVSHSMIGVAGFGWWPRGLGWMLFVVVSGSLWRPRLGKRWREISISGLVCVLPAMVLGLSPFNILLGWSTVLPVLFLLRRVPPLWISVLGVQLVWILPPLFSSAGLIMLGHTIGRTLGPLALAASVSWLPRPALVMAMARRPLTVYVGHLLALASIRSLWL
jgi:hypothetical protein